MSHSRAFAASSPALVSFALALALAGPGGCGGSSTPSGGDDAGGDTAPRERRVVILFTSDEHSHLFAASPELDDFPSATTAGTGALVGGLSRRAALLGRERAAATAAGKDTLTLSAGDNHMGGLAHVAFETGSIDYASLAALGYDATTLGNHELDFGPGALARAIEAARAGSGLPAIVASNVHFSTTSSDDDALAALYDETPGSAAPIHPYRVITTKSGLRIGLLGWMGVDAEHVAPNKAPVRFSSDGLAEGQEGDPAAVLPRIYADLQPVVDALRTREKVDLVIGLGHGGISDATSKTSALLGEDAQIAAHVTGIDLVISGHAHDDDAKPIVVDNAKGSTLVLNASCYGRHVGRVELVVPSDGRKTNWDASTQALLLVDDTLVPDPTQAAAMPALVSRIEASGGTPSSSWLASLLGRTTGASVTNDPTIAGDLYFKPIGKTSFDVVDTRTLVSLSADAMLAAADAWGAAGATTTKTDLALDSAGNVRATLRKGKTGVLSAADAFDVLPLGSSPVDRSLGYPLARAWLSQIELRGVFEATIELGPKNGDYVIGAAGLKVEYDATRPAALSVDDLLDPAKGRVVRMSLDDDHGDGIDSFSRVIFDRATGLDEPFALYAVVTSSYVAQFATDVGATLKDEKGNPLTLAASLLHRADGSEVKQLEAFLGYLHASPGGTLSPLYDATSPGAVRRLVCIKGC